MRKKVMDEEITNGKVIDGKQSNRWKRSNRWKSNKLGRK